MLFGSCAGGWMEPRFTGGMAESVWKRSVRPQLLRLVAVPGGDCQARRLPAGLIASICQSRDEMPQFSLTGFAGFADGLTSRRRREANDVL